MQRIATFTKIHGNGNVEVIVNGIVNKEIEMLIKREDEKLRKKNEELKNLRALVHSLEKKRNKAIQEKYSAMMKPHKVTIREKIGLIIAGIICWNEDFVYIEYPDWIERK